MTYTPQDAAKALLEHIVYHALADRLGVGAADAFIAELALIADGRVRYGALVEENA